MSKSVFKTNQMSSCNNSGSGICYVKSKKFALLEKMSNGSVNNDARNNNMKSIVDKHNYYDKSNFDKIQLLADLPVEKWHIISFIKSKKYASDVIHFIDNQINEIKSNFQDYYIMNEKFIKNLLHMDKFFNNELMYNLYLTKLEYVKEKIKETISDKSSNGKKDVNNTRGF